LHCAVRSVNDILRGRRSINDLIDFSCIEAGAF
jgi:hypothetical protein